MSKIRYLTRRVCELHNKHTFATSLGLCTAMFQRQLRMLSWFLTMCCNLLSFCHPMKNMCKYYITLLSICYQFLTLPISETLLHMTQNPDDEINKTLTSFFLSSQVMRQQAAWNLPMIPSLEGDRRRLLRCHAGKKMAPVGGGIVFLAGYYHGGEPITTCLHF